ncbi:hypothetical protein PHSY_001401 [Pseudozyma hubeiensis SY62]|uniref:Uncharacterized protein n=1 Tax=Pseudozyma hubeiensis (strain SY62) TaxID=1305764 RepID=R9NYS9_PSEHS|nr:hypothetical protein PHSY_001401 [Pseudozyma hubeiensis SY62]GAC93836.1 hypothetical protein PHSY_001401 [Pseudozyma hubeiensis SY62]
MGRCDCSRRSLLQTFRGEAATYEAATYEGSETTKLCWNDDEVLSYRRRKFRYVALRCTAVGRAETSDRGQVATSEISDVPCMVGRRCCRIASVLKRMLRRGLQDDDAMKRSDQSGPCHTHAHMHACKWPPPRTSSGHEPNCRRTHKRGLGELRANTHHSAAKLKFQKFRREVQLTTSTRSGTAQLASRHNEYLKRPPSLDEKEHCSCRLLQLEAAFRHGSNRIFRNRVFVIRLQCVRPIETTDIGHAD